MQTRQQLAATGWSTAACSRRRREAGPPYHEKWIKSARMTRQHVVTQHVELYLGRRYLSYSTETLTTSFAGTIPPACGFYRAAPTHCGHRTNHLYPSNSTFAPPPRPPKPSCYASCGRRLASSTPAS